MILHLNARKSLLLEEKEQRQHNPKGKGIYQLHLQEIHQRQGIP